MNYKQLIQKAEIAREHNQQTKALELLDLTLIEVGLKKRYDLMLETLAQRLIIWLHYFQSTGDASFLELLVADARAGYAIGTTKKVKKGLVAIMLHRIGHYHFYKKEFKESAIFYKASLEDLLPKDKGQIAEYTGHYALSLILSGDKKGLTKLKQALVLASDDKKLRPFHKLIIESGLLIRLAIASWHLKDRKMYQEYLDEAQVLALVLKDKYKMPQRLQQITYLKKNPNKLI